MLPSVDGKLFITFFNAWGLPENLPSLSGLQRKVMKLFEQWWIEELRGPSKTFWGVSSTEVGIQATWKTTEDMKLTCIAWFDIAYSTI